MVIIVNLTTLSHLKADAGVCDNTHVIIIERENV